MHNKNNNYRVDARGKPVEEVDADQKRTSVSLFRTMITKHSKVYL